ncbi:hypothetical protein HID58_022865 [Brassica napus]|uniref:Uncharacterized protein n=1 Tax=Brassica napus TaxID=3708 RepID=A0ABQ8D0I3_BRANA|nr:hypothetical protein HID58_022865 [Brassica napus]
MLFWFVGVTLETRVVKGPSHGVLGGAVSGRKAESRQQQRMVQWEISSTLDLRSSVTVSQTEMRYDGWGIWFWSSVLVEDASQGFLHRRSLPEDELCSGYAVGVHIPVPEVTSPVSLCTGKFWFMAKERILNLDNNEFSPDLRRKVMSCWTGIVILYGQFRWSNGRFALSHGALLPYCD